MLQKRAYSRFAFLFLAPALTVFAAVTSHAAVAPDFPFACKGQVEDVLNGWKSKGEWRRAAPASMNGHSYRSPTAKFGTWVELHTDASGTPDAYRISDKSFLHLHWDAKECEASVEMHPVSIPKDEKAFTDADLKKLLDSGKAGAIYVWYPGFDFSFQSYPNFKKAADRRHLKITVVMGAKATRAIASAQNQKAHMNLDDRLLESVELINRDMTVHYPNVIAYSHGKLAFKNALGAMTASDYGRYFDEQLPQTKGGK